MKKRQELIDLKLKLSILIYMNDSIFLLIISRKIKIASKVDSFAPRI